MVLGFWSEGVDIGLGLERLCVIKASRFVVGLGVSGLRLCGFQLPYIQCTQIS